MLRSLKGLYHLLIAILANIWFRFPSRGLTVIGITGTDGKTTTTTLIYEILKQAGFKSSMITSVHAVIAGKSYDTGFHVTTPSAWHVQKYLRQAADHGDTHMVLEVTSHGIAQHRIFGIRFAVAVITNVTHEHIDWHGTFQAYLATKLSLLGRAQIGVINKDENELYTKARALLMRKRYITYGIRRDAVVTPKTYPFKTSLPGEFNKYNILAALAATCEALSIDKAVALRRIASFRGVPGRMETIVSKPFRVIIDFAHTPNGLLKALSAARLLTPKQLIHVFGSAGLRDSLKRPMMGKISAQHADVSVLTEEDYRTENLDRILDQIASGMPRGTRVYRYKDRREAIAFAVSLAQPGDTVIVTGKGHERSLARGKKEYPWSDELEVKKALKKH